MTYRHLSLIERYSSGVVFCYAAKAAPGNEITLSSVTARLKARPILITKSAFEVAGTKVWKSFLIRNHGWRLG